MKQTLFLFLTILMAFPAYSQDMEPDLSSEISTYYFIRHAEKDRSDPTNRNPHLMDKGIERAENWSTVFEHIPFDVVYSTDYFRTKETAQFTADKNKLEITIYDPSKIDGKGIIEANKGKTILIVGHSDTTPAFVNSILGREKYENIDDDANGTLFILTIVGDKIIDQVLNIN